MKILPTLFLGLSLICRVAPVEKVNSDTPNYDQVREMAIRDFSKTKLYKKDSVFRVSVYDTLHQMADKKIDQRHYKWVYGKVYPDIIAINIHANANKFPFDTSVAVTSQKIPSRFLEKEGKLFIWYDKDYPITDITLKTLYKYHLIQRGGTGDMSVFATYKIDDFAQSAHYYFCRSSLSTYKRIITNKGIGYYDPPNIKCSQ